MALLVSPGVSVSIVDVSYWPDCRTCNILTDGDEWVVVELGSTYIEWLFTQSLDNGWFKISGSVNKFAMSRELLLLMKLSA